MHNPSDSFQQPQLEFGQRLLKIKLVACGPTWIVVDKPCGMSIHNDPGVDLCAVVQHARQAGRLPAMRPDGPALHAVHRLDRDTSGLVLLAGDPQVQAFFGKQFAARRVQKEYLALVHGQVAPGPDGSDWGEWAWPLTAAAAGRKHPAGQGQRLPCTTRWQVLAHSRHYSLIRCMPVSGRKHQIRRHAKLAGHPVLGDRRYGSKRALNYLNQTCQFQRLALHAHRLWIRLPDDARPTMFVSGGLPQAMGRLLESDGEAASSAELQPGPWDDLTKGYGNNADA